MTAAQGICEENKELFEAIRGDLLRLAKREGCRISIGTDSHGPSQLVSVRANTRLTDLIRSQSDFSDT